MRPIIHLPIYFFCFFMSFQSLAQIAFDTSYHEKLDNNVKQYNHRFRVVLNSEGVAKGDTNFRWELDIINMPEEWDYIFQTPLHCGHMKPVTTGKFYGPIKERTEFSVFFTFYEKVGDAELQLRVISLLDSTISDCATFKVEVQDFATINGSSEIQYSIYPNPVIDYINIYAALGSSFELRELSGKLVIEGVIKSGHSRIDTRQMNDGLYIVNIISKEQKRSSRMIVQH